MQVIPVVELRMFLVNMDPTCALVGDSVNADAMVAIFATMTLSQSYSRLVAELELQKDCLLNYSVPISNAKDDATDLSSMQKSNSISTKNT